MSKDETTTHVGSARTKPETFPGVTSGKIKEFFDIKTETGGTALVRSVGHSSHDQSDGDCRFIKYIEQAFYSPLEDPGADWYLTITKGGTSGGVDIIQAGDEKKGCLMLIGH